MSCRKSGNRHCGRSTFAKVLRESNGNSGKFPTGDGLHFEYVFRKWFVGSADRRLPGPCLVLGEVRFNTADFTFSYWLCKANNGNSRRVSGFFVLLFANWISKNVFETSSGTLLSTTPLLNWCAFFYFGDCNFVVLLFSSESSAPKGKLPHELASVYSGRIAYSYGSVDYSVDHCCFFTIHFSIPSRFWTTIVMRQNFRKRYENRGNGVGSTVQKETVLSTNLTTMWYFAFPCRCSPFSSDCLIISSLLYFESPSMTLLSSKSLLNQNNGWDADTTVHFLNKPQFLTHTDMTAWFKRDRS